MVRKPPLPSPLLLKEAREPKWQQAKYLRKHLNDAEKILWTKLRAHRFHGFKFRRQHPIGPYITDFCCKNKKIIVELDGDVHIEFSMKNDPRRDAYLQKRGYIVFHVLNDRIHNHLDDVLEELFILCSLSLPEGEG